MTLAGITALLAIGCASTSATAGGDDMSQRLRYADDKGHYRPDLEALGQSLHSVAN